MLQKCGRIVTNCDTTIAGSVKSECKSFVGALLRQVQMLKNVRKNKKIEGCK